MKNLFSSTIPGVVIYKVKSIQSTQGIFIKPFVADYLSGFYEKNFGEVYTIIFPPGSKRGGHYHKKSTEFFCVIQGIAKLHLEVDGTHEEIVMCGDNPVTIKIPFGIRHVIENIGKENVVLVVYWNKSYNQEDNDTFD